MDAGALRSGAGGRTGSEEHVAMVEEGTCVGKEASGDVLGELQGSLFGGGPLSAAADPFSSGLRGPLSGLVGGSAGRENPPATEPPPIAKAHPPTGKSSPARSSGSRSSGTSHASRVVDVAELRKALEKPSKFRPPPVAVLPRAPQPDPPAATPGEATVERRRRPSRPDREADAKVEAAGRFVYLPCPSYIMAETAKLDTILEHLPRWTEAEDMDLLETTQSLKEALPRRDRPQLWEKVKETAGLRHSVEALKRRHESLVSVGKSATKPRWTEEEEQNIFQALVLLRDRAEERKMGLDNNGKLERVRNMGVDDFNFWKLVKIRAHLSDARSVVACKGFVLRQLSINDHAAAAAEARQREEGIVATASGSGTGPGPGEGDEGAGGNSPGGPSETDGSTVPSGVHVESESGQAGNAWLMPCKAAPYGPGRKRPRRDHAYTGTIYVPTRPDCAFEGGFFGTCTFHKKKFRALFVEEPALGTAAGEFMEIAQAMGLPTWEWGGLDRRNGKTLSKGSKGDHGNGPMALPAPSPASPETGQSAAEVQAMKKRKRVTLSTLGGASSQDDTASSAASSPIGGAPESSSSPCGPVPSPPKPSPTRQPSSPPANLAACRRTGQGPATSAAGDTAEMCRVQNPSSRSISVCSPKSWTAATGAGSGPGTLCTETGAGTGSETKTGRGTWTTTEGVRTIGTIVPGSPKVVQPGEVDA